MSKQGFSNLLKMVIKRIGVHETNSSSNHSIALSDTDLPFILDSISPNKEGNIVLNGDEYAWSWFKSNNALYKANYAATDLRDNTNILIQVIKDHTLCKEVICDTQYAHIDHESNGLIINNYEFLKNFIFNKNSWLFGGNDNEEAPHNFYEVDKYTEQGVIKPTYKYKLICKAMPEIQGYFKEYPDKDDIHELIYSKYPRYYAEDCYYYKWNYMLNSEDEFIIPKRTITYDGGVNDNHTNYMLFKRVCEHTNAFIMVSNSIYIRSSRKRMMKRYKDCSNSIKRILAEREINMKKLRKYQKRIKYDIVAI